MRPFYLAGEFGPLFAVYVPPATGAEPRAIVVHCPAFAEEMNKSRRMVALQARALARDGFGTLVRDALAGPTPVRVLCCGWPREVLPWGSEAAIRSRYRMDVESLVADVRDFVRGGETPRSERPVGASESQPCSDASRSGSS